MRFQIATTADLEAVVALVQSAYRDASGAGWTTEAHLLDGQRTDAAAVGELIDAGSLLLAVGDGGELLATCHLEPRGYFGMFAVVPVGQGAGTGSALLAEAERRAAAGGADALEMTVIAQRAELIAWYERRGYTRTGETQPFPYGDERFGRPRREDLEFVVLRKRLDRPA